MHIALVAGEVSGDILGAGLIKALKQRYPNAKFTGIAGPLMKEQGCEALFDMEELSVMGLVEVLGKLRRILQVRRQTIEHYQQNPPDVFIGIDAPDFNLHVEDKLHQSGIKTVHYVSPSVWAWKQKRVFKIKRACNRIMVFLPFEKAFYQQFDVPCEFVGHTLADQIPMLNEQAPARAELGLAEDAKVLAMLPGSRKAEVGLLTPVFLETVGRLLRSMPNLQVLVPLVNAKRRAQFEASLAEAPKGLRKQIILIDGQARLAMQASDVVLLASGTATLEAMLVKRPMAIAYKFNALTYHIAKLIVKAKFAGLPNLLADRMIVNEFIHHDCTADQLEPELLRLFQQDSSELLETFTELHQQIRCDADNAAARVVAEVLEEQA